MRFSECQLCFSVSAKTLCHSQAYCLVDRASNTEVIHNYPLNHTVEGCEILHHQTDGFSTPTKSWDLYHRKHNW